MDDKSNKPASTDADVNKKTKFHALKTRSSNKSFSLRQLAVFVLIFGVIGSYLIYKSFAATSMPLATPGLSRLALGTSASIATSSLPNYSYVLLSVTEDTYIPGIKSVSPSTKVLGYESATEAFDDCSTSTPYDCSPISYQQALAHDQAYPSDPWVIRDAAGNSLTMPGYPSAHIMNVGSTSFQQQWTSNATAALKSKGFNGIYIDSVIGKINADTGLRPVLYPSDDAWQTSMRNFMAYIGPTLKNQGMYVLANSYTSGPNDGSADIAWWNSIAGYVNGLQSEYWEQAASLTQNFDTNPCCWTGHWLSWLGLADAAQNNGADFFTVNKGSATDTQSMTYLRGSYLLVWNGKGGGFDYSHEPDDRTDPANPAWTTYIGTPTGARYQVGSSWRRDYTGGTVVVNPDASVTQTINLGGNYQTIGGATVSSVTLGPRSAAILTASATAPPTSSAPSSTALPTLSGVAVQGTNMYSTTGTWSGSPTGYSYQWKRCDASGSNCKDIAGEIFSGITVSAGDVGSTMRMAVTASNASGSSSVMTNPTSVVTSTATAAAPANTGVPTISGTAVQGSNMYSTTGDWSGSPTGYTYQWKRCDTSGSNCKDIGGEIFYGITVSAGDVGSTLRNAVTASNATGKSTVLSTPTAVVAALGSTTPANTALPTLSGVAVQGTNMYSTTGTWSGNPTKYTYQWKRCDTAGGNCKDIGGEIFYGITVSSSYVGYTMRMAVTASNSSGASTVMSNPTAVVK